MYRTHSGWNLQVQRLFRRGAPGCRCHRPADPGTLHGGAGFGQTITGTVQGYISDVEGGAIPGATVTVTNQDTGIARAVISDANGFYSAKALQVGTYSVTAELSGMQTTQQGDVSVLVGQIEDVNPTLEIESTSEVITVTSEAPIIEVSRSGTANYIDEVAMSYGQISCTGG